MLKNSTYSNKIRFLNNYLRKIKDMYSILYKKKKRKMKNSYVYSAWQEKRYRSYIYTRCVCFNKDHKCTHESVKPTGCVIMSLTYLVFR